MEQNNQGCSSQEKKPLGVFIIEDNDQHFLSIKNNLLPSNCRSILDPDNATSSLTEQEKNAISIFQEDHSNSLKKSENFVIATIKEHREWLRLIICDLQINGNNEGGTRLIRAIKHQMISDPTIGWFAEHIPILILSNMTDKIRIDAFRLAIGSCYSFLKEGAFQSEGIMQEVISNISSNFDTVYNQYRFKKTYKVALSFTGSTTDENGEEIRLRGFIQEVAHKLYEKYQRDRVFYDKEKMPTTASSTKGQLAQFYTDSEYIVVFLSKKYVDKESEWARNEWEVIRTIVQEGRVIFVKLDNTISSDDLEKKLGIETCIYNELVGHCSKYNDVINGKDQEYITYMVKNFDKRPITDLAGIAIKEYQELQSREIEEAAQFIIDTIKEKDDRR